MGGRRLIPLTLLGVMTLLIAGAGVWGQLRSPDGATITVQNATAATYGEPLGSTSFTMDLASNVSASGTKGFISSTRRVLYISPNDMVVAQTKPVLGLPQRQSKAQTREALKQYGAVTGGVIPWAHSGKALTRTESFTTFSARVTPGEQVADGTVHESVVIRGGYLVLISLRVLVPRQTLSDGAVAPGGVVTQTYRFLRINGRPAPALAS
jgi:hypothetical protein